MRTHDWYDEEETEQEYNRTYSDPCSYADTKREAAFNDYEKARHYAKSMYWEVTKKFDQDHSREAALSYVTKRLLGCARSAHTWSLSADDLFAPFLID